MSSQVNTETLSFRIGLSGTFWDKRPEYSISVDGVKYVNDVISIEQEVVKYHEFLIELNNDQEHILEISLLNKDFTDVVKDPPEGEPYKIVKDMLLNIESIEIDKINLDSLLWTQGEFIAEDPNRPPWLGCLNLGWNGAYTLKFTTPFYIWLLENS